MGRGNEGKRIPRLMFLSEIVAIFFVLIYLFRSCWWEQIPVPAINGNKDFSAIATGASEDVSGIGRVSTEHVCAAFMA